MENEWTYQLSLKLGQDRSALLNVRAKDIAEFAEALRNLTSNANEVANAAALFDPPKQAAPPQREAGDDSWPAKAATPQPPAPKPTGADGSQEIGPLTVVGEIKNGVGKKGPWILYVAKLGSIRATTFDGLIGSIVLQLNGKQAIAQVRKSERGYDLLNIRPA